ncbi:hypothetical protein QMA10_10590 [Arthrobacter sp. APC 3897]|uniref:hypothetical protein n=1 Tax=Arthrobacter sp. APC 3897 TaxID=3035204 RepID=UPI0025B34D1C|nr:hypothetical protein [Arthrobacter sp. APC 3897]MDN3482367.1 hypothetical protein [Arthrobacter sp. APC 3897]
MSSDSTAARIFGISTEDRVTVYGAADRPEVAPFLPAQAYLAESGSRNPANVVVLFAGSAADLAHELSGAAAAVESGGVLWVCYPSAAAVNEERDLNRDTVVSLMEDNGWQPLADASVSEAWSAVRGQPTPQQ